MRITFALVIITLSEELSSKQMLEKSFTMCLPALDYIVVCDHKNTMTDLRTMKTGKAYNIIPNSDSLLVVTIVGNLQLTTI